MLHQMRDIHVNEMDSMYMYQSQVQNDSLYNYRQHKFVRKC